MDKHQEQKEKAHSIPEWAILNEKNRHVYTNAPLLGRFILDHTHLLYFKRGTKETLYHYDMATGLWQPEAKQQIDKLVTQKLLSIDDWSSRKMRDTTTLILSMVNTVNATDTIDKVQDPDKVHFANGVYSFKQNKLLPHSPKNYFTSGRNYSLKAKETDTPFTDKWLVESLGASGFEVMMQYIGYIFYRSNQVWQSFIILLGDGGDGKSTFFNWLSELIGSENTSTVSLAALTDPNNRFALSRLVGKSLNYDADITGHLIKDPTLLKKVTGNDGVDVESKGQQAFKVWLFAKLMFGANDLPPFRDSSKGFKRRALIIRFNRIPDFHQRYNLQQIYQEIPAFVYKCLRAFWEVHTKTEITPSKQMESLQKDWIKSNNHVAEFVEECCEVGDGYREKKIYVYNAYKDFCSSNGYRTLSNQGFKKEIERLEVVPRIISKTAKLNGKPAKVYLNIKLVSSTKVTT